MDEVSSRIALESSSVNSAAIAVEMADEAGYGEHSTSGDTRSGPDSLTSPPSRLGTRPLSRTRGWSSR